MVETDGQNERLVKLALYLRNRTCDGMRIITKVWQECGAGYRQLREWLGVRKGLRLKDESIDGQNRNGYNNKEHESFNRGTAHHTPPWYDGTEQNSRPDWGTVYIGIFWNCLDSI